MSCFQLSINGFPIAILVEEEIVSSASGRGVVVTRDEFFSDKKSYENKPTDTRIPEV